MARNQLYPPSVTPGIPNLGICPYGWTETTLKDVLTVIRRPAMIVDEGVYQLVTAKRSRGGIVPREKLKGKSIRTKTQFFLRENDFLISRRQIIHGACGIVPQELDNALVSGEYSVLRVKPSLLLKYLKYLSETIYFQQTCFQSSVGVDVEKMIFDLDKWLGYKFQIPRLEEQQSIVDILDTWEKAIDLGKKQIDSKHQLQKTLEDQLLNGKKRFPGFTDDWIDYHLGEIATLATGGTPDTKRREYWGGNIPWMNSGEINLRYVHHVDGRITTLGLENSNAKMVPVNSVLIALAGQGKTRGMVAVNYIETTTNQSIAAIIPNPDIIDFQFLFHSLNYRYQKLRTLSGGDGGRGGLNLSILRELPIKTPPLSEQRKIAQVLKLIDSELELLAQRLNIWKIQQKSLVQQLLTGKVRVKI